MGWAHGKGKVKVSEGEGDSVEATRTHLEDEDDVAERVVDGEDDHGGQQSLPKGAEEVGGITSQPLRTPKRVEGQHL